MKQAHPLYEETQWIAEFAHALLKAKKAYEVTNDHAKYCEHLFTLGIGLVVVSSAFSQAGDEFLMSSVEALRLELFDRVADVTDLKLFVERINAEAKMKFAEFMTTKRATFH